MTDDDTQADEAEPQIVDVTITAPDADWLRQHCAMLIEKRLAASANIIPVIDSIYRWQGEIHHATEAYAILHARAKNFTEITRLTNESHPYETVHVLRFNVDEADQAYRRWVVGQSNAAG